MVKDLSYFIRRTVFSAVEKVVQRYNAPATEPRGNNLSAGVISTEEKIIFDAANGHYGLAGKVAVYIARSKFPREIGIYMPQSDVIAQTAPHLAETSRTESENHPARTSAVIGQSQNGNLNNFSQGRYEHRYKRPYASDYRPDKKDAKVYTTAQLFGKLRQGKVYSPESQRSADAGYDPNGKTHMPARVANVNDYKNRRIQTSNSLPQRPNSGENLEDRLKYRRLDFAA